MTPVAYLQKSDAKAPPRVLTIPSELPGANAPPLRLPTDEKVAIKLFESSSFRRLSHFLPNPRWSWTRRPAADPGRPSASGRNVQPGHQDRHCGGRGSPGRRLAGGHVSQSHLWLRTYTVETGPAGYPGFFVDQVIKTGGKLTLQQAAATMDVLTAKLALRRARADLRNQMRGFYFAVLVARENARVGTPIPLYRGSLSLAGGDLDPGRLCGSL